MKLCETVKEGCLINGILQEENNDTVLYLFVIAGEGFDTLNYSKVKDTEEE
jgi:hypothetical protein